MGSVSRRALIVGAAAVALGRPTAASGGPLAAPGSGLGVVTQKPRRVNPPDRVVSWTIATFGTSVLGAPLERWDLRPDAPTRRVVVVCGIHGDERGALDLAAGCGAVQCPDDLHLTIVPLANPDGWAAGRRNNARGVDLNRNYSWGWRPTLYSGRRAMSEPETVAVADLLTAARPDLVIWMHQPLAYVTGLAGCPAAYAQLWSNVSGVRNRPGVRQVGGGESWTAFALERPSMLIEVAGTRGGAIDVDRHTRALEELLPLVGQAR